MTEISKRLNANQPLLELSEMVKALGPCDRVVSLDEFRQLLVGLGMSSEGIGYTMAEVYRGYQHDKEQRYQHQHFYHEPDTLYRPPQFPADWRDSEELAQCRMWLYDWDKPREYTAVVIGGIFIPGRRYYSPMRESYWFLVEGDRVVDSGRINRTKIEVPK